MPGGGRGRYYLILRLVVIRLFVPHEAGQQIAAKRVVVWG